MGSSKKVTIGYKYYMDLFMGVCRGPVNEVVEIRADDKKVYYGPTEGAILASTIKQINKSGLFGGDKKEGGIQGPLHVMMGENTQVASNALKGLIGNDAPGFRGVLSVFYSGLVSSMTPYIKEWKFRVRRTTKGWYQDNPWYTAKATINLTKTVGATVYQIQAANPAHIIYECCTNPFWGGGHPVEALDDASFREAADKLYAEGFGLCLLWSRESTVQEFIQIVVDHIGGNFFQDRFTGLYRLELTRDDYDVNTLPTYTMSTGMLSIESDEVNSASGSYNEVVVNWIDPIEGEDRSVRERNIAAINADGYVTQKVNDYTGIPTQELAARVAARDLKIYSSAIKRLKIKLDRRGYGIQPGSVFKISSPLHGIENMIVRAGKVEDGSMDDGTITVTAVQDVFGLPSTSLSSPQPIEWTPPDRTAVSVSNRLLREATYWEISNFIDEYTTTTLDSTASVIQQLGSKPTDASLAYQLATSTDSFATYQLDEGGDFCPTGLTTASVAIGVVPITVSLSGGKDLDFVVVGDAVQIDNEIFRVDSITSQTYTDITFTIARGCVDTVPAAHSSGARCFVIRDIVNTSFYTSGASLRTKMLTQTNEGTLAVGSAPYDSLTVAARQAKPYPPANVKIGGVYYPTDVTGVIALTWDDRNRLTQADQLISYNFGSITKEPGVLVTLNLYNNDTSSLIYTTTGVSGNSLSVAPTSSANIRAELNTYNGSVQSLYKYIHTFAFTAVATIYDSAVIGSGAVGYWPLSDLSGTTVVNQLTTGNGTAMNGAVRASTTISTGLGLSTSFDGVNDYINVPYNSSLAPTTGLSIEAWFNITAYSNEQAICSKAATGGYYMKVLGENIHFGVYVSGSYRTVIVALSTYVAAGTGGYAVGTYDGRYVRLYVGNTSSVPVLVGTTDVGSTLPITYTYTNHMTIGTDAGTSTTPDSQYLLGRISNVAIYPTALSLAQITDHSNKGRGL